MKKIFILPMLLVTFLFTLIFINNDVYAAEIDTNLQFNKTLYQFYMYDPNTELDYFDIYLQTDLTGSNNYVRNLHDISMSLSSSVNTTFIYTLNPSYLIDLYRGSGSNRTYYDTIGYVSLIYATYSAGDFEFTFYDNNNEYLTTIRPSDLPYNDIFMHTSYINVNASIENAFESGRQQGYNEGVRVGDREGYERGYERARDRFAYYLENQDSYLPAENWGETEYNRGFNEGLQSTEGAAYDKGYLDGSNDSFMANIKNWIVPAIIVVIILGGFVTIIQKRKSSDV